MDSRNGNRRPYLDLIRPNVLPQLGRNNFMLMEPAPSPRLLLAVVIRHRIQRILVEHGIPLHGDMAAEVVRPDVVQQNGVPLVAVPPDVVVPASRVPVPDRNAPNIENPSGQRIVARNPRKTHVKVANRTNAAQNLHSRFGTQYQCNICHQIGRNAVATICGHMYCWFCIWKLQTTMAPDILRCPICKQDIRIYEDVIPIYDSLVEEADGERGDSVERPAGYNFNRYVHQNGWFFVDDVDRPFSDYYEGRELDLTMHSNNPTGYCFMSHIQTILAFAMIIICMLFL